MRTPAPKSLNPNYLRGWFQVETGGNSKLAAKLAARYLARVRAAEIQESSCTTS